MSPAPRVTISREDQQTQRSSDTNTGKAYLVGLFERGPADRAILTKNLAQVKSQFGLRQTNSTAVDEAELFYGEGGAEMYVQRVVGPAAVKASKNLLDGSAAVALTFTANDYGAFANSWTIANTLTSGNFTIVVSGTNSDGTPFTETLGPYATTTEAVAAAASTHGVLTQGASTNDPVTFAATALTGGTDDYASVTDAQRTTAANLLRSDYGPGQVILAGITAATTHGIAEDHAEAKGRTAILQTPDTSNISTLTTIAASDRTNVNARNAELLWPWLTIPPLVNGGPPRVVPAAAGHAGIMSRNDGQGVSPNQAAAGDFGQFRYATGLSQPPLSDADRDTLANAGITVIVERGGVIQVDDDLTVANPSSQPNWQFFSSARYYTSVRARALEILRRYQYRQIDSKGHLFGEIGGDITGMLLGDWSPTNGPLYGDTPAEAFNVDLSENTLEDIQAGNVSATLALRIAPPAKNIDLAIIKVALTASVA